MFWMSATNPYGASPGLSQSDNGSEQVNTIHTSYHAHTIDMIYPGLACALDTVYVLVF